ncbi:MAG: ATP-binding cassette domain-containing protein [Verrucomicrobiae bacterium]|nr:ATP-binding cassette domain-containing protein [Verrucomicrobiae bacterium]
MIEVKNLSKTFGTKKAVDEVSFRVEKGEVLGFLGPNGAGKSTTMRMITGFTPPTAGTARIGGHDIIEDPISAQRLFGYLPENAPSYEELTVLQFLNFSAEIRSLRGMEKQKAVDRVLEMCFLTTVKHQLIDTLSKGYRHRTCFAQSIIHDPEVLILDEPTDGLDPNQKHEVRTLIRNMGQSKAIIFSTHILEEVEAVCTRAIIIDRGKIVANGTPHELKQRSPLSGSILLKVSGVLRETLKACLADVAQVKKINEPVGEGRVFEVRLFAKEECNRESFNKALVEAVLSVNGTIMELHEEEGKLDEVFRHLTLPDTEARKIHETLI